MLIRITDGVAASVLAYYAPRGVGFPVGPLDEDFSQDTDVQTRKFLRGATAKPEQRGNAATTFNFGASIQMASLADAQQHLYTWPVTVCRDHTLELVLNAGQAVAYRNAALFSVRGRRRGVRVDWSYSIVAGEGVLADALLDSEGVALFDAFGSPLFTEAELNI